MRRKQSTSVNLNLFVYLTLTWINQIEFKDSHLHEYFPLDNKKMGDVYFREGFPVHLTMFR